MQNEELVRNVKKCCELKGVSVKAACEAAGLTANFMTQVKDRGSDPGASKVRRLAQYLGCTASDLLGETKNDTPMERNDAFAKNVENRCKELGTNMTAASRAAGLSPNFMTKVKHGADPGLSSVVKLAHSLGCTVSDLLGEEKSSPPQQGSELRMNFADTAGEQRPGREESPMQAEVFVQNVIKYCEEKGVKPTVACEESGAGRNLIGQLKKRGTIPSVERVQLLAQYLGCTVSDLLGEKETACIQDKEAPMDREKLVQNIERYCAQKGVKPTNACRESGVGSSFLTDIKRGRSPSVVKMHTFAEYLGCTVSDLLGEGKTACIQNKEESTMDREKLVQNIERYCAQKGVKPTNACRESGVGSSFLTDIKRGQTPSVAKMFAFAQYLGCTVSDLLGEERRAVSPESNNLIDAFNSLDRAEREELHNYLLYLVSKREKT